VGSDVLRNRAAILISNGNGNTPFWETKKELKYFGQDKEKVACITDDIPVGTTALKVMNAVTVWNVITIAT